MKTTTKLFLVAVTTTAFLASSNVKAQTTTMTTMDNGMGFKIGIGVSAGITRDQSPFSYALGADVKLQYDLSTYVALTASGGYTRLFPRDNFPALADYDFIPAIGGVKVFPIKRMFIAGNIGAGFAIKDGSKTSLIFGGGTGYEFNNGLELGIRYEGYQQDSSSSTYQRVNGQYALRIGYNF
jgi:opacity protein-like surface antigen